MRVFVTGVAGQLGYDVVNELSKRGHEAIGSDVAVPAEPSGAAFELLDITDGAAVEAVLTRVQPDAVVRIHPHPIRRCRRTVVMSPLSKPSLRFAMTFLLTSISAAKRCVSFTVKSC